MTQRPPNPNQPPAPRPPIRRPGAGSAPAPRLETFRPRDEMAPQPGPRGAYQPAMTGPRGAGTRRVRPRRRRSALRIVAWTIGGLGVLAAAGIGALVLLAPVGLIRDQLVREVKARTGRDLIVAGRTSLSILPSLAVSMNDVSLSAAPGMAGPPLVKMRRLEASAQLMPLLSGRINVEQVVLTDPVFELRVDGRGRRSWDFAGLVQQPHVQLAQAPSSAPRTGASDLPPELADFVRNATSPGPAGSGQERPPAAAGKAGLSGRDLGINDLRIENGTVRYRDERAGAGTGEEIRAIHARLSARSLAAPAEANGSFALRGDRIEFDARLTAPKSILEQRPARVVLALSSPRASGRYDGSLIVHGAAPALEGALRLETQSLRGLAAFAGAALPEGSGFGPLSIKGDLKAAATSITLANAELALDGTQATGSLGVELGAARPMVRANLRVGAFDLNRYTGAGSTAAATPRPAGASGTAAPARRAPGGPGSIDDLLQQAPTTPGPPQVRGFVQRSSWSEAPIDATALGLADADVTLRLAGLTHGEIKVGATQVLLALSGRVLKATLEDVRLYDGQGRGTISLDASNPRAPALGANLSLDGVSALPLLKDAAGFDWLAGKARIQLALTGQGGSEKAIVESLGGRADLTFADGAIVGLNIPQMIRNLSQGRISGFEREASAKTDFSEAGVTYEIKAGVAETKTLRLMSPLLRMTGTGTVDLGKRQLDTTLRPKLVASLTGQGGAADLTGIELPVRIRGPWEKPQIGPDMSAVLKDPNAMREIGKQLQGSNIGNAVRGLLGRGGASSGGPEAAGTPGATPADGGTGEAPKRSRVDQIIDQLRKR